jgi:type II secretion system protein C
MRHRLVHALPQIAAVLAAVAIVGQLAATTMALMADSGNPQGRSPGLRRQAPRSRSRLDPAIGQLFGSRAVPLQTQSGRSPPVALVLTGVIAGADPTRGFGILGQASDRTALYGVGAALPGDARLAAVFIDRVEVDRDGQRQKLWLPLHRAGRQASLDAVDATAHATAEALEPQDDATPAMTASRFWRAHQLALESTDASGRVIGYKLTGAGKHGSPVRPNDILTAINGVPVTDRESAQQLISAAGSNPAHVTVLRNGSPIVLTVDPDK